MFDHENFLGYLLLAPTVLSSIELVPVLGDIVTSLFKLMFGG